MSTFEDAYIAELGRTLAELDSRAFGMRVRIALKPGETLVRAIAEELAVTRAHAAAIIEHAQEIEGDPSYNGPGLVSRWIVEARP